MCAENLVNPSLAHVADQLIARLAPLPRGKGFRVGPFASATSAVGGGSLWIAFPGSDTAQGRLYILGPGPRQASVRKLPSAEASIGGLSPLGPDNAYLWTQDGRLFSTVDGGAQWNQVVPR